MRRSLCALSLALVTSCSASELPQQAVPAVGGPSAPAPARPADPDPSPVPAPSRDGWNTAQIHWLTFDDGLAAARTAHKPICLVLSTTWCPHCANYSHVFEDPQVVAAARDFVMVRADADAERALSQRFAPDGAYVPRTYFLSASGELLPDVKAHDGQFAYFYGERDPSSILGGMQRARASAR